MQEQNEHINDKINTYRFGGKDEVFEVPKNYFNNFQADVHSKIARKKKVKTQLWYGVSVGMCTLLLAYFFLPGNNQSSLQNIASLPQESVEMFFSENPEAFSVYEIADVITHEDLDFIRTQLVPYPRSKNDRSIDDLKNEEIYEYLIDEGIDDEVLDYL